MTNIVRSLSFAIVQAIYPLIPDLYGVVMDLASNRYFTTEAIQTLSGNIYIVISVCMLFALGIKLISSIVNPDMLTDQKKGVKSVAMHAIFAVFLIVLIPIGFDKLYEVQGDVVENQLIEKVVLGMDTSDDAKPGQILAAYAFASFCAPNESGQVSSAALDSSGADLYNKAITEDISNIKQMDGVINSKTNGEYDLDYNAIISPAVGIYLVYQLILMAMDMALRTIKLGVLQLITPVILCAYVVAGTDILQKWAKMVMSTFVLLFLKIAMISFMIYGLSLLPDFLENFSSKSFWYRGFLRLFMIIGLLQLIKQIPDIINNIFGTSIKSRGGIRGRLGEMAAVGDLAQRGWDQLRQHPLQTAQRLVSAPLSAVGGGLAHTVAAIAGGIQRGRATAERLRNEHENEDNYNGARLRGFLVGAGQSLAGIATAGGAAWRAGRQGLQNGNLRGIGEAGRRYEDTHPGASTFLGRTGESLRSAFGINTSIDEEAENDKYLEYNGVRMSVEQLQRMKSQHDDFLSHRDKIRGSAMNAITDDNSRVYLSGANTTARIAQLQQRLNDAQAAGEVEQAQNYQRIIDSYNRLNQHFNNGDFSYTNMQEQLQELQGLNLQQRNNESDAAFAARVADHQRNVAQLQNDLAFVRDDTRDRIVEFGTAGDADALQQMNVTNRDRSIIGTEVNTLHAGGSQFENYDQFDQLYRDNQNAVNAINTRLEGHQAEIYRRQNTEEHRTREANVSGSQARNNNNGGNNGGNGH